MGDKKPFWSSRKPALLGIPLGIAISLGTFYYKNRISEPINPLDTTKTIDMVYAEDVFGYYGKDNSYAQLNIMTLKNGNREVIYIDGVNRIGVSDSSFMEAKLEEVIYSIGDSVVADYHSSDIKNSKFIEYIFNNSNIDYNLRRHKFYEGSNPPLDVPKNKDKKNDDRNYVQI